LLTNEPSCNPNNRGPGEVSCEWIAEKRSVCHVFILNKDTMGIEAVSPLNIARYTTDYNQNNSRKFSYLFDMVKNKIPNPKLIEGWPSCYRLIAMAISKEVPNGILFTLGYYDSAAPADPANPPPEFVTTILMLLREENGKPKLFQDDSCLGNPNTISTISDARKTLRACNAAEKNVTKVGDN
jgi:hypothetical protein